MNILIKGIVLKNVKMVSVNYDTSLTIAEFEDVESRNKAANILHNELNLVFDCFGNTLLQFKESFSVID